MGGINIDQFSHKSITDALEFVNALRLTTREQMIAKQILKEIRSRLQFLSSVGLDYLMLSRAPPARFRAAKASASGSRRRSAPR